MKFQVAVCHMVSGVVEVEIQEDEGIYVHVVGEPDYYPTVMTFQTGLSQDMKGQVRNAVHMAVADRVAKLTKQACSTEIERVSPDTIVTKASA